MTEKEVAFANAKDLNSSASDSEVWGWFNHLFFNIGENQVNWEEIIIILYILC